MRKALFAIALGLVVLLAFQSCGPFSVSAQSRRIIEAAVATPPIGYLAGEVEGANWLSTEGNQQNFQVPFRKALTAESVDSECSYLIEWANSLGATHYRDGQADESLPLVVLSGNEHRAQQKCIEVLTLGIDPANESGSAVWQIFGSYQSDGKPAGDFYINVNHSYHQEVGKADLAHNMHVVFFTMLDVTP